MCEGGNGQGQGARWKKSDEWVGGLELEISRTAVPLNNTGFTGQRVDVVLGLFISVHHRNRGQPPRYSVMTLIPHP